MACQEFEVGMGYLVYVNFELCDVYCSERSNPAIIKSDKFGIFDIVCTNIWEDVFNITRR
jgi:hypothetical protein